MKEKVSVIVPTYNEKDNVSLLTERIHNTLKNYNYEIVFVDDNSADGTADAVRALAPKYPVKVIVRTEERGLATAVIRGFNEASGEVFVVIDADLQHPPEVIPSLLTEIEKGADVAIPSRYIPGGGCEGWSFKRRMMSKGAIAFGHLMLPKVSRVSDPVSGFFALRRGVVTSADLRPIGYKILLEILMMGHYQKVAEVPYVFRVRENGESKLSTKTQVDYVKQVFDLMKRTGEFIRFLKFCVVGGSGVVVNLGLYLLLTRLLGLSTGSEILLANAIAIECSILSNFALNDVFTFRDRRRPETGGFRRRLFKFNLVSLGGLIINMGIFWLLTRNLKVPVTELGLTDVGFLLVAIAAATLWNYLINRLWTWKS